MKEVYNECAPWFLSNIKKEHKRIQTELPKSFGSDTLLPFAYMQQSFGADINDYEDICRIIFRELDQSFNSGSLEDTNVASGLETSDITKTALNSLFGSTETIKYHDLVRKVLMLSSQNYQLITVMKLHILTKKQ